MAHFPGHPTLTSALPLVRADGRGYVYGRETVDGFADRPELPLAARVRLARLAERHAPKALSDEQVRLLATPQAKDDASRQPSDLQDGFQADRAEAALAWEEGVYAELTAEQRDWVAEPGSHPALDADTRYPLTMRQLHTLTGASERQLRHWADEGLMPTHRTGTHRRFYSAAAARALLLAEMSTQQVAALIALRRGGPHSRQLMVLIASILASAVNEARTAEPERSGFLEGTRKIIDHRGALASLVG